jgi:hypothetical protein
MFVAPQRSARFEPDTMTKSSVPPNAPVALHPWWPPMLKQPTASISSNFPHMLLASYITGAFCVAATGAFLCHQGDTLIH